jgi:hypothetical protein
VNEPLKSRWTRIWRVINSWLLAMDPDPWEYMHSRMRRLEEAVFARESAATPTPGVGPPPPDSPAPRLAAEKPR